jgi:hypothetical protein
MRPQFRTSVQRHFHELTDAADAPASECTTSATSPNL